MGEYQYKRTLIQQEIDEVHKRDAYINASAEERAAIDVQLAQSAAAQLKEISRDEEQALINKANLWKEYGQAIGDVSMLGQGRQLEVSLWEKAQEFDLRKKFPPGPELDKMIEVLHLLAQNKSAQIKLDTAGSFEEYASAYSQLNSKSQQAQAARKQLYQDELQSFREVSSDMVKIRLAGFDEIIAYAKKTANVELAAFEQVRKEEAILSSLQNKQKYGSPVDSFWSTMSINYGGYKSDMTRARDDYVALANDIKELTDGMFDSFSTAFGSIIKGLATGSMDMQDIWSTLLGSLGDMFSKFAMNILERWFNDLLGQMLGSTTSSLTSGLSSMSGGLLGLFGFAHGGTFAGTTLPTNSILTSPTLFTTADSGFHAFATGGMGVAGEAGPEIIMPAVKMPSGNYGVRVQGGDGSQASKPTQVNASVPVKIINVWDESVVGDYLSGPAGEKKIMNIVRRNGVM